MTTVTVVPPKVCAAADLDAFKQMVIEGGEVEPGTLSSLLGQALALAFARVDCAVVGVGAIKRPYDAHRAKVFAKAKSLLNPSTVEFELGWFYVHPSFRGNRLASKLVQALMPSLEGRAAYTTSRTDNDRMHASLKRVGFVSEGMPFPSKMNKQEIQLFICQCRPTHALRATVK